MEDKELIGLTAHIVAAYVENNSVPAAELPSLIASVHAAMRASGTSDAGPAEPVTKPTAAQIRKSIQPTGLVNFEDGKVYKSLKRNLATRGLTPEKYREKWGLPKDYPMVSPAYSAQRSALAKKLGLGQMGRAAKLPPSSKEPLAAPSAAAKPKRARSKSAKA